MRVVWLLMTDSDVAETVRGKRSKDVRPLQPKAILLTASTKSLRLQATLVLLPVEGARETAGVSPTMLGELGTQIGIAAYDFFVVVMCPNIHTVCSSSK
jgi:hypothetical protein